MERQVDDIRQRTWAPFVGAALAALTAGSLVVFSLVAQRTSLDGFPELRIATPTEATQGRPASITVQPVDGNGDRELGSVSNDMAETTDPVAVPLALIPLVPATIPSAPVDLAALADPATSRVNVTGTGRADGKTFDGRFRAEGALLAASRDGGSEDPGSRSAARHKGKHTRNAHEAKSKKEKAKKSKKSDPARSRRSSGGRGHTSSSAGSRSNGPQSGSKPSAAHKAQPSPQGPPAHSNAGGNSKSHGKSKGKGHKKH